MISTSMMTADVTLTYKTEGSVDAYNRPSVSESSSTVKAYYRGRRTNTLVDGGDILKTDSQIILQPDTVTDGLVSVTIHNETFSIDGEPVPHWNPRTAQIEYIAVYLRKGNS